MDVGELLAELFGRIPDHLHRAVDGLSAADLEEAPFPGCNTIGWRGISPGSRTTTCPSCWGVSRCGPVARGLRASAWRAILMTPDMGTAEQVARVRPDSAEVLIDYYEAVAARTARLLAGASAADLGGR